MTLSKQVTSEKSNSTNTANDIVNGSKVTVQIDWYKNQQIMFLPESWKIICLLSGIIEVLAGAQERLGDSGKK